MLMKSICNAALGLAVLASVALTVPQFAFAQSRVNDKVSRNNGASFFANGRASRNIQHSRNYSQSIQQYATHAPTLNPVVTKSESEMLGRQIQGIQREMIVIREENLSNPKVVEQVKGIETKLVQAVSTQQMLHEECCKDSPNGKVCADMAGKLTSTLDQVAKDHAKLMKEMGHEDAAHDHAAMKHEHDTPAAKTPSK